VCIAALIFYRKRNIGSAPKSMQRSLHFLSRCIIRKLHSLNFTAGTVFIFVLDDDPMWDRIAHFDRVMRRDGGCRENFDEQYGRQRSE
jgi:hypothetical protein